ncbi:hypothetical protein [Nocardia testacea]|uniref:hypothetical protein n=1 Tax=Nocardia testacea TaxID=248551 RepID=UPI0002F9EDCD|nr:hypothetical protein [Nocardia testacea]
MSVITPYIGQLIGLLGGLAGAFAVWHAARTKTAVEARTAVADDEIERERLADERLRSMLDSQRADFEAIVQPLRDDVDVLRREVRELHSVIDALRARYRIALDYVRQLLSWARTRPDADTMPAVPQSIADEV